jgi:hypothetical protein
LFDPPFLATMMMTTTIAAAMATAATIHLPRLSF